MKKISIILIFTAVCFSKTGFSQQATKANKFTGAQATFKNYKALYFINQSDEKKIKGTLRNMDNALNDPRLKGKLQLELVAFGEGVELFRKNNHYDTLLLKLQNRGVILAQCSNTIKEKNISKDELWPFISYVPSGNGEIIIRQAQGWAIIHP